MIYFMPKTCFVVCPIGDEKSEIRSDSDKVLDFIISPVCTNLEFDVIRVDKINEVDRIDETILKYLKDADLVIVDMTTHNPNVFYEFGFRHAIGKPLIPILKKGSDSIPFDVANLRTTYYSMDVADVEKAKQQLSETIANFTFNEADVNPASAPSQNTNIALLNMNDKLDQIIELISIRNDEEIDKISSQVAKYANPAPSMETALMSTVFTELIKKPDAAKSLKALTEIFPPKLKQ